MTKSQPRSRRRSNRGRAGRAARVGRVALAALAGIAASLAAGSVAALAAPAITPATTSAARVTVAAPGLPRPTTVYDASVSLAVEASRARLGLFVDANPLAPAGQPDAEPTAQCPLVSPDTLSTAAIELVPSGGNLQLQLDPWTAGTTTDPELRPDAAPPEAQGLPVVRCVTSMRAGVATTRAELFALDLIDGVTFGDVARLNRLDPALAVTPAGVGGEMVGSCQETADTGVCVVVWQSRRLALGLTLEGPPAGVNPSTAAALLTDVIPDVIDTLAVVRRAPLTCDIASLSADTGVTLLSAPLCDDGWAFGTSVECPPPPPLPADPSSSSTSSTSTTTTTTPFSPCRSLDVFHVESGGWVHNGSIDSACAENLTRLGMTVVTARAIAPVCEDDDPSVATGGIRPDAQGLRVTALQVALTGLGYVLPIDGTYGPLTEAAVVDYQITNGLTVDGITGSQTQGSLGI